MGGGGGGERGNIIFQSWGFADFKPKKYISGGTSPPQNIYLFITARRLRGERVWFAAWGALLKKKKVQEQEKNQTFLNDTCGLMMIGRKKKYTEFTLRVPLVVLFYLFLTFFIVFFLIWFFSYIFFYPFFFFF